MSGKSFVRILIAGAGIAIGSCVGYKLATDKELKGRLLRNAQDILNTSKKKVGTMSEDVALKTAQLTKNPQINQEWVEKQWEAIGA